MDNLGAHETPKVRGLLDRSGFPYRYLPSYSPDLNPIEPAWAQVKAELRRVAARKRTPTTGARPRARPRLRRERQGLLPPLWLRSSRLTRGLL